MKKITSLKDFSNSAENLAKKAAASATVNEILVCTGGGCIASGSMDIVKALENEIAEQQLDISIK